MSLSVQGQTTLHYAAKWLVSNSNVNSVSNMLLYPFNWSNKKLALPMSIFKRFHCKKLKVKSESRYKVAPIAKMFASNFPFCSRRNIIVDIIMMLDFSNLFSSFLIF